MYCKLTSKITYLSNNLVPDNKLIICSCSFRRMRAHSHFIAFGMMNLQFEIRICQKIHNKGTMSQWQIYVTFFLSETDFTKTCSQHFFPETFRFQNLTEWTVAMQ